MARREYPGVYPYPAAGGRTLYRAFYTDSGGVPRQKRGFTSPSAAAKFRSRMQVRAEHGELRITRETFAEHFDGWLPPSERRRTNATMSTHVVNELFAQPGRGEDVANLLVEILGESLEWEGCEAIRIVRDQDNPDQVAGFTQWTRRQDFETYLGWRTARGFTATFEEMLTQPFVIHYYDELYFGTGIATEGAPEEEKS